MNHSSRHAPTTNRAWGWAASTAGVEHRLIQKTLLIFGLAVGLLVACLVARGTPHP